MGYGSAVSNNVLEMIEYLKPLFLPVLEYEEFSECF